MTADTTDVIVARGRTIQTEDGRQYGPGETAPVPNADLRHLKAGGWIHDPEQDALPRTSPRPESNPSQIGLQKTEDHRA